MGCAGCLYIGLLNRGKCSLVQCSCRIKHTISMGNPARMGVGWLDSIALWQPWLSPFSHKQGDERIMLGIKGSHLHMASGLWLLHCLDSFLGAIGFVALACELSCISIYAWICHNKRNSPISLSFPPMDAFQFCLGGSTNVIMTRVAIATKWKALLGRRRWPILCLASEVVLLSP